MKSINEINLAPGSYVHVKGMPEHDVKALIDVFLTEGAVLNSVIQAYRETGSYPYPLPDVTYLTWSRHDNALLFTYFPASNLWIKRITEGEVEVLLGKGKEPNPWELENF